MPGSLRSLPEDLRWHCIAVALAPVQADLLGVSCVRPTVREPTALGAAFLGGLGAGLFENTQAITDAWVEDRTFQPAMPEDEVARRMTLWSTAVSKA